MYKHSLPAEQIVHANFDEICKQPLSVIQRIYQKAGRTLGESAIQGCQDYDQRRPAKYWGSYDYSLEEFNLTAEEINRRFSDYRALFC